VFILTTILENKILTLYFWKAYTFWLLHSYLIFLEILGWAFNRFSYITSRISHFNHYLAFCYSLHFILFQRCLFFVGYFFIFFILLFMHVRDSAWNCMWIILYYLLLLVWLSLTLTVQFLNLLRTSTILTFFM